MAHLRLMLVSLVIVGWSRNLLVFFSYLLGCLYYC
jgi:hypothetical protein